MSGSSGVTGRAYQVTHLINTSHDVSTNYFHGDQLGSSRLVLSANGYPTWQATYLPFGEEYNPQIGMNTYKFTGYDRDSESGLDYAKFRYHSSQLARFMSPDSLAGNLGSPQSLNRYSYVNNDPINLIDPFGLEDDSPKPKLECLHDEEGRCLYQTSVVGGSCPLDGFMQPCGIVMAMMRAGAVTCAGCPPDSYIDPFSGAIWRPGERGPGVIGFIDMYSWNVTRKKCSDVAIPDAPGSADMKANIRSAERSRWLLFMSGRLTWFYSQVRSGGPWDYKSKTQTLGDAGPSNDYATYVGSPYTDFGNFHYGVVGAAAGIQLQALLRGAGGYQKYITKNSEPEWGGPFDWTGPYGDDPINDVPLIIAGFNYYKAGCHK